MSNSELLKRYGLQTFGLLLMAFGVAVSTEANLGISPISCVPYVLSLGLPMTMGLITFIMHIVFILLQILLLRRNFQPIQLLQLPLAIVFSAFTDLTMFLVPDLQVEQYVVQIILLLFSCLLIGLGVSFQVKANVVMLAGEGLVGAFSKVFRKEFGKIKVYFDCILVASGAIMSIFMFNQLLGVREGTILSALLIGTIVRFIVPRLNISFSKPKMTEQNQFPLN